jgi:hypothetical protein
VTVNSSLSVFPASATLTASSGQALQFTGQRGVPPYTYALISGRGSLSANGVYTVGSESGTAAVQVTDSRGATAVARIRLLRIRVNGAVSAIATDGTSIYLGGRFNAANPYSAPRLLVADAVNGNPVPSCDLGTGFLDVFVNAVLISGNTIYVGGTFNLYNGTTVNKLAKIDATTCAVDANFSHGTSLYAGGYFLPPFQSNLVKRDLATGAFDSGFYNPIAVNHSIGVTFGSLTPVGGQLYVGTQTGMLYREAVSMFAFPLDSATGAPLDP